MPFWKLLLLPKAVYSIHAELLQIHSMRTRRWGFALYICIGYMPFRQSEPVIAVIGYKCGSQYIYILSFDACFDIRHTYLQGVKFLTKWDAPTALFAGKEIALYTTNSATKAAWAAHQIVVVSRILRWIGYRYITLRIPPSPLWPPLPFYTLRSLQ